MTHISRAVNRSPVLGTIFGEVYTHLEYNILHTDTEHNSYTNFTAKFLICIHFKDSIFYVNATDNEVAVWMCLLEWKNRTDKIIIKYK